MSKTCVITGASGFLGREVVPCLSQRYRVVGLSHRQTQAGLRPVDLRDTDAFSALLDEVHPDAVVHMAAYRSPDYCEQYADEARRLNVEPTRVLCERLPPHVPLVMISTDYVFDGKHPPYREGDRPCPVNVYGHSKAESELWVLSRPHSIILRAPLLVGAGASLADSGFITEMLASIRSGQPEELDDILVRRPTWTRDVANGIAFLLQERPRGVFHISGGRGATRYQWTREAAELIGQPAGHLRPSTRVVPRRAQRPPDSHLDDHKIHALGLPPCTDFRDVLRIVLSSF